MSILDSIVSIFSPPDPDYKQIPEGNPARGKRVFQDICAQCHYIHANDSDSQAPKLGGLFGRKTGNTSFQSSASLRKANFKWSQEHLFKFLRHPQKYIPGINMTWYGTKSIQQRSDLIAYLKMQS